MKALVRFPHSTTPAALLLGACLALPLAAADRAAEASDPALAPPIVKQQGEVRYLTGGVGIEGRQQLAGRTQGMNLQLVFAEPQTGALHARVDVRIADPQGREVLKIDDADPMLFAELAPGRYLIEIAQGDGRVQREVTVPERGLHRELLLWS